MYYCLDGAFCHYRVCSKYLQPLETIINLDIQDENYFEFFTHYCPFPSPQLFLCSLIYLK